MRMYDGPLIFLVNRTTVDTVHSKPKMFAAGARVKAPDDYKVLDHPAWNAAQTESG